MKKSLIAFMVIVLSGCSSNSIVNQIPGINTAPEIKFQNQFLRGVFNWWEASPAYQLKRGSDGWYVDVELIADGQPYDFKLSDKVWTPSQTCGAKYQGQTVTTDTTVYMICGSDAENLQFTPQQTGVYRFTFASASSSEVRLEVTRQ